MIGIGEIKKSFLVSLWFMFLTFPIMVIKVNPIENLVQWRWGNLALVGVGSFTLSIIWRAALLRRDSFSPAQRPFAAVMSSWITERPRLYHSSLLCAATFVVLFPFPLSTYQTNIMITALMYVVLGLGLNIVVGLAGLLDLGYVAFYAVGAYSYALLNHHYGLSFWLALPLGAAMGALFGIILGFPVLRLRGD